MKIELGRCRLGDILHEIGWSQQVLADSTGLSKDSISKYIGKVNIIPLRNAILITEVIYAKTGKYFNPRDLYEIIRI